MDLYKINSYARERNQFILPCIFLAQDYIETLKAVLEEYSKNSELLTHVLGFGVEGPLLGRFAGVPPRGILYPTATQWEQLAELGKYGLKYIVMGSDGGDLDDEAYS